MRGVPLATVSNFLGHTSPTMTLRYTHLAPKHLFSAIRFIDPHSDKSRDSYLTIQSETRGEQATSGEGTEEDETEKPLTRNSETVVATKP